jgi:hypothetical protein
VERNSGGVVDEIEIPAWRLGRSLRAEVLPMKGRVRSKYLEAMMIASLGIVSISSYLILGGGISWKIWGSGLAIGIAVFAVGWVMLPRKSNGNEEDSNNGDAEEH